MWQGDHTCFFKDVHFYKSFYLILFFIPLQARRVREVANLTERKNPHISVYGVKEFVCLSVTILIVNKTYTF